MARKKRTGRKATTRRRSGKPARRSRRGGRVRMAGFGGAVGEIVKGVAGALIATKVGPMIPVGSPKTRNLIVTGIGAFLAVKGPNQFRSVGIGMGIAGGTLVLNDYFPNLLGGSPTVGRLSPEMTARMQRAADEIRGRIGGLRGRTIMGDGGVMGSGGVIDFPQTVRGSRGRTIMGGGDPSMVY